MRRKRARKLISPIFDPVYIGDKRAMDYMSLLVYKVWVPALREVATEQGAELMELDRLPHEVTQEAHGWRNRYNLFPTDYHKALMDEYFRRLKQLYPDRFKKG
jgi:hypothetical protein